MYPVITLIKQCLSLVLEIVQYFDQGFKLAFHCCLEETGFFLKKLREAKIMTLSGSDSTCLDFNEIRDI